MLPADAVAAVASQFSFSVAEEYNDNIFFVENKQHDFVTYLVPTFSLLYAPTGQKAPTFTADFTPVGQIFARHGEESNFGDNIRFRAAYTYQYSPQVTFRMTDTLRRLGETRGQSGEEFWQGSSPPSQGQTPGTVPSLGAPPQSPGVSRPNRGVELEEFISRGDQLTNHFSLGGDYRYTPNLSFSSSYDFSYASFLDQGGRDILHSVGARGSYRWREEHNLFGEYTVGFHKSRDGEDNIVHNFDVGDDYFSTFKIELTPTLTVLASGGVALNTGSSGPRIATRTNVTATKLWERAALSAGVTKGLTPSFGVGGISDTTSFFGAFNIRLTEFLTGFAGADYSFYDTDDVNFDTFQAGTGLRYRFTSWFSSTLGYVHRRIDSGSGAETTDLLTRGKVNSNSAFLIFTAQFDLWPNLGLARGQFSR